MTNKIYHLCKKNEDGVPVKFSQKNKRWERVDQKSKETNICNYCPDCGIKLPSEEEMSKGNLDENKFVDERTYFFNKKIKEPIYSFIGFK